MANYFALLTNQGAAKLANAAALGIPLKLTTMAVGDGNGQAVTPNPAATKLVNEKRRAPLNALFADPLNASQLVAEQIIPETVGGWWIRELGLYDEAGTLIAVANCPDTYKPLLSEGSGRTQVIRMVLIVSSTSAVELKIDPAVVLATRQYVDEAITTLKTNMADNWPRRGMAKFQVKGVTAWQVPPDVKVVKVTVIGGGGGGGGASSNQNYNAAGGGGGGGGTAEKVVKVTPGDSITVTVGAGGLGGIGSATSAKPGETSSFGTYCSATGGSPGNSAVALASSTAVGAGNPGGMGVGGDLNKKGGPGGNAVSASPSIAGLSVARGHGGASSLSGGGNQTPTAGEGGSGVATAGSNVSLNGSAGADGMVLIEW